MRNIKLFRKAFDCCGTICKSLVFLILLMLFFIDSFAAARGQIRGRVTDEETSEGLDFAVIALLPPNNDNVIKSMRSDEGGKFSFDGLAGGVYRIKVSYVGYVAQTIGDISVSESSPVKVVTVKLKKDVKVLGEVVITDSKPEIEYGADTITYNVGQSIQAEGSMAADVLKDVPMVDVDIDGKVSIAGKRNTRVFINGKPSDYTASSMADLLSVLPSDAIDRVEVITNPDIRYSADGDGIINIVLKKGYKIGLNGTVSANAGTIGSYTGTGYVAYRTDNLVLGSSFGYRNVERSNNSYSLTRNYKDEAISSYRNRYNKGENTLRGGSIRANLDWDITEDENFNLSVNSGLNYNGGDSFSDDYRLNSQMVQQELRNQSNNTSNSSGNIVADANYSLKLNKKRNEKFEAGLTANLNRSDIDRTLDKLVSKLNQSENPFLQYANSDQNTQGFLANADYSRSIGKRGTLSAGIQASIKQSDNTQDVNDHDFINNADTVNSVLTNSFTFFENIYSAYAGYNLRTLKRWSFRLGTRAELTDARFEQEKSGDVAMKPYFNIFPSASVSKTFNKKYITGLSYSVRIARPRENALNPIIDNRDSTNIFYGNPGLKPAVTQQTELSFSTFSRKWSFSPRVGFSHTSDIIERVRIPVDDKGNVETTYRNLASSDALSFSLFGSYKPTKKVSADASFTLSNITYHSGSNIATNRGGLSYSGKLGLALKLPERIAFEGNLHYMNNASAQGRTSGSLSSGLGIRKLFMQNKLVLKLLANDPFNQRSNTETIEGLNYTQERYSELATRNFSMVLSYRFTKTGRNTVNKQKKDKNEKEDMAIEGDE